MYHSGAELVTDWPALFVRQGFTIVDRRDIIADTIATWDRVRAVYEQRSVEAVRRYGHRLAHRTPRGFRRYSPSTRPSPSSRRSSDSATEIGVLVAARS